MSSIMLEADCSAVQKFMAENSNPSLELALYKVPQLVECLIAHDLVKHLPRAIMPIFVEGLRAVGLNISGLSIKGHTIGKSRLRGCIFTGTQAESLRAYGVEFIGCYFHGSDFVGSNFSNCKFIGCEISKNDFRDCDFEGSSFLGCDIYANWARRAAHIPQNILTIQDAFGFGELSPWEQGVCDGHEVQAL